MTEAHAIATVHASSWQTSYRGIVPGDLLTGLINGKKGGVPGKNPDRPGNTLVALIDEKVVGFADAGQTRSEDCAANLICGPSRTGRKLILKKGKRDRGPRLQFSL